MGFGEGSGGDFPDGAPVALASDYAVGGYSSGKSRVTNGLAILLRAIISDNLTVIPRFYILANRLRIVVIPLALAHQKQVFVRLRAAVCNALRHGIRFAPNYVLAEPPAIGLKGEGDTPWNTN